MPPRLGQERKTNLTQTGQLSLVQPTYDRNIYSTTAQVNMTEMRNQLRLIKSKMNADRSSDYIDK